MRWFFSSRYGSDFSAHDETRPVFTRVARRGRVKDPDRGGKCPVTTRRQGQFPELSIGGVDNLPQVDELFEVEDAVRQFLPSLIGRRQESPRGQQFVRGGEPAQGFAEHRT